MTETDTTETGLTAHRDPQLEAVLAARGINAAIEDVDIDDIDWPATTAGQVRSDGVDPDTVDRYTAALERGEVLPAGFAVRWPAGITIEGGIHRAWAYQAAGRARLPMYVADAAEADPAAVRAAAIEHNSRHGLPMSQADRERHALALIDDHGMSQGAAAATVGLPRWTVQRAAARREGDRRARRLGQGLLWTAFGDSARTTLASALARHTDTVFVELVATATSCRLDVAMAKALAAGLGEAETEDEALEFLEGYEAARHPAATRPGSHAARLRPLATSICDIDPDEVAASTSPSFVDPTLALLRRAAKRLAECALALEQRSEEETNA